MRKSRYSDSQILAILKQNEQGMGVPELCRELGLVLRSFTNGGRNLAVWMHQ